MGTKVIILLFLSTLKSQNGGHFEYLAKRGIELKLLCTSINSGQYKSKIVMIFIYISFLLLDYTRIAYIFLLRGILFGGHLGFWLK